MWRSSEGWLDFSTEASSPPGRVVGGGHERILLQGRRVIPQGRLVPSDGPKGVVSFTPRDPLGLAEPN